MAAKKTKTKRKASLKLTKPVPAKRIIHLPVEVKPEPPKLEISVRTIYNDGQWLPALCFRSPGPAPVPAIIGNVIEGVRLIHVLVHEHDKAQICEHGPSHLRTPYPPERFAAHMRAHARNGLSVSPEARALLLPLAPDMPAAAPEPFAPQPLHSPGTERPAAALIRSPGPSRVAGQSLIRELAIASGLPPEKIRAKLRAAGLRAPYTDSAACRQAVGVKS